MNSLSPSRRFLLSVLFIAGGGMIFLLGNNWNSLFLTNDSTLYKWGLVTLFLALAAILQRSRRGRDDWEIAFALFVAAFANALNWSLGNWLVHNFPAPLSAAQVMAVDKLAQFIPVVGSILLITRLAGGDMGSIYLKKGNLQAGLRFGLISFAIFAGIFAVIVFVQAGAVSGEGLTAAGVPLSEVGAALPWIILFIFWNSLMEELWFRGIFLRRLLPHLGAGAAVFATALVFALPHVGAVYISPIQRIIFPVVVFLLGIVNARVMLKTDSIWGSVLFHAGYDLMVIIPILVTVRS